MNSKIIYFRLTNYNGLSLERSVLDDAVLLQEVPVPVCQVRLAAPLVVTLSQRESQLVPHQTPLTSPAPRCCGFLAGTFLPISFLNRS